MVVRMRRNRSQTAKRRSHHALSATRFAKCECGASRLSHRACPECGRYNGRVVVDMVSSVEKKAFRQKRRDKDLMASGKLKQVPDHKHDHEHEHGESK